MKRLKIIHGQRYKDVAPRRGAWIETLSHTIHSILINVAPRRGAWIETEDVEAARENEESRTPQGCVD